MKSTIKYKRCYQFVKNLTNIKNETLIDNHINMAKINKINTHNYNPTACGTSANAIFNIFTNKYNKKFINITTNDNVNCLNKIINKISYSKSQRKIMYMIGINAGNIEDDRADCDFFPGHSFILIKLYENIYSIVQSYIDSYTIQDWVDNNKVLYTKTEILDFLDAIYELHVTQKLTKRVINAWDKYVDVDLSHIENFSFVKEPFIEITYTTN